MECRKRPRKTSKSYLQADKLRKCSIPDEQLEILYGCLLGDSGMVLQTNGEYRICTTHCVKQRDWLTFKMSRLPSVMMAREPAVNVAKEREYEGHVIRERTQCSLHSIAHPGISALRPLFYRGKRPYVSPKLLNLLTTTSLLVWYIDDGSYNRRNKNAIFCTNAYDISVVRCIKKWLWKKHRIESSLLLQKAANGKRYPILRITVKGTETLFSILTTSPLWKDIPDCIKYKFGI